jgi:hypothetical protein
MSAAFKGRGNPPPAKYGNKKITVGGITFDSRREAKRYQELYFLQKAGKISDLELQKRFELVPAQYETFERYGKKGQRLKDGQRCVEKAVFYVADFCYVQDGQQVVEDTKGVRTKDYIIKRKLLLWVHGIRVKEV